MKRDITTLVEQSKIHRSKSCPMSRLTGDAAEYVAALEKLDYEDINKAKVKKIFQSEFDLSPAEKKLYAHFNPAADCGC